MKEELIDIIKVLQSRLDDKPEDCIENCCEGCDKCEETEQTLTVGQDEKDGEWDYQSGDNSYTGPVYCFTHWGVATFTNQDKPEDVATQIIDELLNKQY